MTVDVAWMNTGRTSAARTGAVSVPVVDRQFVESLAGVAAAAVDAAKTRRMRTWMAVEEV